MSKLTGKVAVITGGSTGMGLATARLFVAQGARVVITGRNKASLDAAVAALGDGVEAVQGDIANLADLDRLRDRVAEAHGHVDVIFANAGGGVFGSVADVSEADFDRTVDTNLKGTFFTVQKLLPLMRDGGSIILNTSIAGSKGLPDFSVYSATKAALRSFARTWTTDLKARRIRVNALAPGQIDTEIMRTAGLTQDQVDGFIAQVVPQIPLGRMGEAAEIAKVALFLASDDSSYVTGIELTVDGGWVQV
ncbi:MAG: glucose 1-dehydrogenase [Alphaproteobacteria bacterium]|nr:glucose 1-dehydrogenase [Alphaproteobacteria bacterium]MBU1512467.1 glucose 1-dehydrogenase [Alphaproteobacteria bacterium]MBU2096609.1 glucose 1-dehydrogenase [Alphaproteobacteria bacterium]MBU2151573.1 glucose 1-dehydrogenase [Alphaproteobacteria bacterium]MBU2307289.1 glucose 1-dehydrogenase [Alphaproteobacteria bacterium]